MYLSKLSEEERKQRDKEKHKEWVAKNIDHVREYQRNRYRKNIEYKRHWAREYRQKNLERMRKQAREYRKRNKDKVFTYDLRAGRRPERRFDLYVRQAKKRGLQFELTMEQFMTYWQKPCGYCGSDIDTIGLDRIDNKIGYLEENITPCCSICNWMKKDFDKYEFINHCAKVAKAQLQYAQ